MLPEWDNRIVQRLCCACLRPLLAVLPHKLPKGDAVAGAADKSAPVKVQITVLRDGEGLQGQDAAAEVHKDASCGLAGVKGISVRMAQFVCVYAIGDSGATDPPIGQQGGDAEKRAFIIGDFACVFSHSHTSRHRNSPRELPWGLKTIIYIWRGGENRKWAI